jgi:coproporphyrinogen III oxidase-like Fe-S oxidoreductase
MSQTARGMLSKRGYKSPEVNTRVYYMHPGDMSVYDIDAFERNTTILGLGSGADSHVFGRLIYTNPDTGEYEKSIQSSIVPAKNGIRMNIMDEARRLLVSHIPVGITRQNFLKLFGRDVLELLPNEVRELQKRRLIHLTRDRLDFRIREEDIPLYSKLLYSQEMLKGLKEREHVR